MAPFGDFGRHGACRRFFRPDIINGGYFIMRLKILSAVLAAAIVFAVCTYALPTAGFSNQDKDDTSSSQKAEIVITLDSDCGATASDVKNAVADFENKNCRLVLKGEFKLNETLTLKSGVTIDAREAVIGGSADVYLAAFNASRVRILGGKWNVGKSSRLLKMSSCTDFIFDGLDVTGGGSFDYGNAMIYSTYGVTIRNCTFREARSQVIFAHQSDHFELYNCSFSDSYGHAVYVYSSDKPQIIGNRVSTMQGDGIKLVKCTKAVVSGNKVDGITFNPQLDIDPVRNTARSGCGILLSECDENEIGSLCTYDDKFYHGNEVSNCENYGIHITMCRDTMLDSVSFSEIGTDGIHNSASASTTIQNCRIKNCKEKGIFFVPGPIETLDEDLRDCRDSVIRNNTIDSCSTVGIMLSITNSIRVLNNNIIGCRDYGIFCNTSKNIYISGGNIAGTKDREGLGISYSDDCSNIDIDMPFAISDNTLVMGKGDKYTIRPTICNIKWKTNNSSIVSVNEDGEVTANGTGAAIVTALTSGDNKQDCKVTVKQAAEYVELSKRNLTLGAGEKYTLTAALPEGTASATVRFHSTDSSLLRMDETHDKGVFTAMKPGAGWVTVQLCNGVRESCKVTIKNPPSSVSLNKQELTVGVGEQACLKAVLPKDTASSVRNFRSSDSSVISMTRTSGEGHFKAMSEGTAWVTVRLYNGVEASCKVIVKKAPQSVELNKKELIMGAGEEYRLSYIIPEGTAVTSAKFSSSDKSVAEVSPYGKIIAVAPGSAKITVKLYNGVQASCIVTVKKEPDKLELNKDTIKLKAGQSSTVWAKLPSDAASLHKTFRSSNSSIVELTTGSWSGSFKALRPGTAWITVKLYNGLEKSCKIIVE